MTCSEAAGSGSAQCMWRITQSDKSNYTTCTANDDCGDGVCSELENMAASICPQDCLGKLPSSLMLWQSIVFVHIVLYSRALFCLYLVLEMF